MGGRACFPAIRRAALCQRGAWAGGRRVSGRRRRRGPRGGETGAQRRGAIRARAASRPANRAQGAPPRGPHARARVFFSHGRVGVGHGRLGQRRSDPRRRGVQRRQLPRAGLRTGAQHRPASDGARHPLPRHRRRRRLEDLGLRAVLGADHRSEARLDGHRRAGARSGGARHPLSRPRRSLRHQAAGPVPLARRRAFLGRSDACRRHDGGHSRHGGIRAGHRGRPAGERPRLRRDRRRTLRLGRLYHSAPGAAAAPERDHLRFDVGRGLGRSGHVARLGAAFRQSPRHSRAGHPGPLALDRRRPDLDRRPRRPSRRRSAGDLSRHPRGRAEYHRLGRNLPRLPARRRRCGRRLVPEGPLPLRGRRQELRFAGGELEPGAGQPDRRAAGPRPPPAAGPVQPGDRRRSRGSEHRLPRRHVRGGAIAGRRRHLVAHRRVAPRLLPLRSLVRPSITMR